MVVEVARIVVLDVVVELEVRVVNVELRIVVVVVGVWLVDGA